MSGSTSSPAGPTHIEIRTVKPKAFPRDLQPIQTFLEDALALYHGSQLCINTNRALKTAIKGSQSQPTKLVSLGLGSLVAPKGKSRRIKQLAILLAIRDEVEKAAASALEVYAQDPTFTRNDEILLSRHGIRILHTPSGSELGEAASIIDSATLVFSPFLTLEAYEQLLVQSDLSVQFLVGDDFSALLQKWPRHSAERAQVDGLIKSAVGKYRRRAISGEGFWTDEDHSFAMAVYSSEDRRQRPTAEEQ
jgi:hypothetical protein